MGQVLIERRAGEPVVLRADEAVMFSADLVAELTGRTAARVATAAELPVLELPGGVRYQLVAVQSAPAEVIAFAGVRVDDLPDPPRG